ncbi:MAG: hypothetical protein ACOYKE_00990 [Ferruginibacter sp.]
MDTTGIRSTAPIDIQHTPAVQSPVLSFLAKLISYVFHPVFIPLYVTWFLTYVHPGYFAGFGVEGKRRILLLVTLNAVLFPIITVLLLKGLGFIDSLFLRTQKDRIIPYIASMIFFFWTQYVLREQPQVPRVIVAFMFGVFISSSAALIANIYNKVSMHAIGVGGLIGVLLMVVYQNTMLMTLPLSVGFLIAGLVCSSRLMVSDHSHREIITGFAIGLGCQLVGAAMYL